MLVNVSVPLKVPVVVGVNVTSARQLPPAASVAPHEVSPAVNTPCPSIAGAAPQVKRPTPVLVATLPKLIAVVDSSTEAGVVCTLPEEESCNRCCASGCWSCSAPAWRCARWTEPEGARSLRTTRPAPTPQGRCCPTRKTRCSRPPVEPLSWKCPGGLPACWSRARCVPRPTLRPRR